MYYNMLHFMILNPQVFQARCWIHSQASIEFIVCEHQCKKWRQLQMENTVHFGVSLSSTHDIARCLDSWAAPRLPKQWSTLHENVAGHSGKPSVLVKDDHCE